MNIPPAAITIIQIHSVLKIIMQTAYKHIIIDAFVEKLDVIKLGSMNAIKTNAACKALYERLRANGKTGKQGLIAVCNKLLKQVFVPMAIGIKNNSLYQPNHCSANP